MYIILTAEISIIFVQIDPHLVFAHWKYVHFNNLLLEPYLNSNICGTEPYRAEWMKLPKGKYVKTQYIKGH